MFFDIVLLNPQHRGQFGKVWIAGTRGVRYISIKDLKEINLCQLCDNIMKYIVTKTTSPQKRFSLRLSCTLINGAIRIFKQQAILLCDEVCAVLQIVHIPVGTRNIPVSSAKQILGKPLKQIVKIKTKKPKKPKLPDEPSPLDVLDKLNDVNLDDVFNIQQTSDLITLPEDIGKPSEQAEEEGLGVVGDVELLLNTALQPSSSTSSAADPVVIQVEAQIHTDKENLKEVPVEPLEVMEVLPIEKPSGDVAVADVSRALKEIQLSDIVAKKVRSSKKKKKTIDTALPDIENLQITETSKKKTAEKRAGDKEASADNEASPKVTRVSKTTKVSKRKLNLTRKELRKMQKLYIKWRSSKSSLISESSAESDVTPVKKDENNNEECDYDDEAKYGHDHDFKNQTINFFYHTEENETYYKMFITSDIGEPSEIRTDSKSSRASKSKSKSGKRSTLEGDVVRETTSRGLSSLSEVIVLADARTTDVPAVAEVPMETILPTPEEVAVPTLEMASVETDIQQTKILTHIEEDVPGVEPVVQPVESPKSSNFVQRRQSIIQKLMIWNFEQGFPTIVDLTEKPINRLHITRTFYDLLTLCSSKYVDLITEDDTIELKYIKKGPKLENLI